jgi:hypothetical protein
MPQISSYHRSRPSVDRVIDLLADIDESQIEELLQDINHTTSKNITVAKGIDFFENPQPAPMPKRQPSRRRKTYLSSISTLNLRETATRHDSSRISSAPELPQRPKSAGHEEEDESTRPDEDSHEHGLQYRTPRSYKRISRPWAGLPSPTATPDLHDLLAAYLSSPPTSSSMSSGPSSPTTPLSAARFIPSMYIEPDTPGVELLEPSPTRMNLGFGRRPEVGPGGDGMSGIFEVLSKV